MRRALAESWGYVPDARDDWYAQHRARRCRRFSQTEPSLRETRYDRTCPLCGVPLGGVDRYVFPVSRSPCAPRAHTPNEVFSPRPRPACLVACASCLRLYRGELCDRYNARNACRTPQE